jgi:hypothetical protein
VKCRTARNPAAFHTSVAALRDEIQVVSENNRSVRVAIEQMNTDASDLAFPAKE